MKNYIKVTTLFILLLFLTNHLQAQCLGCTTTISTNSNASITIDGDNQKVCITGGVYTGTIILNGNATSLCIGSSGTIGTGANLSLNGSNITIDNYGTVNLANLTLENNANYNNSGITNIDNGLSVNDGATYSQLLGTTTVTNQVNINANLVISGGAFRQANPSQTFTNNSIGNTTVTDNAIFEVVGSFDNNGPLNIINSNLSIGGNFTNNTSPAVVNLNGSMQVTGNAINNGLIQVSGNSCSKISANNFTNNSTGVINGTSTANIDICSTGTSTNFGTINNPQPVACECNVQLAIQLFYFFARLEQSSQRIVLDWLASSDEEGDRFYIEKSTDGLQFRELALINAIQSVEPQRYTFRDEINSNGYFYYRLKMKEGNGKTFYSETKVVKIINEKADYEVYPNPAKGKTYIKLLNVEEKNILVNVYNLTGVQVGSFWISPEEENEINLEKFEKGIYLIECLDLSGKEVFSQRRKKIILID